MGTGKTTFSEAFITAMTRLSETDASLPYGCVFLVEQMVKADDMFHELNSLLPGKVAVWTSDHDVRCKKPTKVLDPDRPRFHVDDLQRHPVAIVTHKFFKGKNRKKAKTLIRDGVKLSRALTIVDEQQEDVTVYDVTTAVANAVLEAVQQNGPGRRRCDET